MFPLHSDYEESVCGSRSIPQENMISIGLTDEQSCSTDLLKLHKPRIEKASASRSSAIWVCANPSSAYVSDCLAVSPFIVRWLCHLCLSMQAHRRRVPMRRQVSSSGCPSSGRGLISGPHDCHSADPQRPCICGEGHLS
jgi:hypothetical protein